MKIQDFTERHPPKQQHHIQWKYLSLKKMCALKAVKGNLFFFYMLEELWMEPNTIKSTEKPSNGWNWVYLT